MVFILAHYEQQQQQPHLSKDWLLIEQVNITGHWHHNDNVG